MKFQSSLLTFTAFLVGFYHAQSCPTGTLKFKLPSLIVAGSKFHAQLSLTNTDGSSLDDADIHLYLPDYVTYVAKSSKPIPDSIEEDSVIGETDIWWKAIGPIKRKKTVNFKLDLEVDKCAPSHFEIHAAAFFGEECIVEKTKEIKLKYKGKHTCSPTNRPTSSPTTSPTNSPTSPTTSPTNSPTSKPTSTPTSFPTALPTTSPTFFPTATCTASTCNGNGNCNNGNCYTAIGNCTNQDSYQACLTTLTFTTPVIPCSSCPNQPASIACTGANSGSCVVGNGHGPTKCMIPGVQFDQGFCYCSS